MARSKEQFSSEQFSSNVETAPTQEKEKKKSLNLNDAISFGREKIENFINNEEGFLDLSRNSNKKFEKMRGKNFKNLDKMIDGRKKEFDLTALQNFFDSKKEKLETIQETINNINADIDTIDTSLQNISTKPPDEIKLSKTTRDLIGDKESLKIGNLGLGFKIKQVLNRKNKILREEQREIEKIQKDEEKELDLLKTDIQNRIDNLKKDAKPVENKKTDLAIDITSLKQAEEYHTNLAKSLNLISEAGSEKIAPEIEKHLELIQKIKDQITAEHDLKESEWQVYQGKIQALEKAIS